MRLDRLFRTDIILFGFIGGAVQLRLDRLFRTDII